MDRGATAVGIAIAFTALSGSVLLLRCISRFFIVKKFGVDDVTAILAYLSSVTVTYLIYAQYQHGLGQNITQVKPLDLVLMLKYLWASVIVYGLCMTFIKISALTQSLRFLFSPTARFLCWALIVSCASCGAAATFVSVFSCQPIAFSWNKMIPDGKCINLLAWWFFASGFIILTDMLVVAIPIVAVKDLNMPRAQKRALIVVFALGGFICISSILRLHSVYVAATSTNITKDNAEAAWWSAIEMNIGITCISIPPLKALGVAISPRLMGGKNGSASNDRLPLNNGVVQLHAPGSAVSESISRKHEPDPWAIP